MMVQCSFARRCIGKVHGVSQLQFRSKNPGIGNEIQPAPVRPVGGCCLMDGMDQEGCVSIRSAISVIYPIPDFIFSVARMACGNPFLNIDILKIGPACSVVNRPGFPDTLCPCKRRLKGKPDDVCISGNLSGEIIIVDQKTWRIRCERPMIPVYLRNHNNRQVAIRRSDKSIKIFNFGWIINFP